MAKKYGHLTRNQLLAIVSIVVVIGTLVLSVISPASFSGVEWSQAQRSQSEIRQRCMDLSTGSNGDGTANPFGTQEGPLRWHVDPPIPSITTSEPLSGQLYSDWLTNTIGPYSINHHNTWADPGNSANWIFPFLGYALDPQSNAWPHALLAPTGTYRYRITFPAPWTIGTLQIDGVAADNRVNLYLDSSLTPFYSYVGYASLSPAVPAQALVGGPTAQHTLTAVVTNDQDMLTYTGLLVKARLCPVSLSVAYSAKFICRLTVNEPSPAINGTIWPDLGVVDGEYQTDINIHNPSFSQTNLTLFKKFVVALPEPSEREGNFVPAVPFPYVLKMVVLQADAAMRIDCHDIIHQLYSYLSQAGYCFHIIGFTACSVKGFVELYSPLPLDVVAEYSSKYGGSNSITLEVVVIPARKFTP